MKDNLENFKQVSDEILKNVYVTDELERKTLEKCNNKRFFKLNPLIISTASAAALIVTFGIYNHFSHNTNVADNSIKHEYKNTTKENKDFPKIVENKKIDNSKDLALNNGKKDNTAMQNKSLNSNAVTENTNIKAANENTNINSSIKDTNSNTVVKNTNTTSQNSNNPDNKNLNTSEDTSKSKTNNEDYNDNDKSANVKSALIPLETSLNTEEAEKYFESKILIPSYVPEGFSLTNISIPDRNVKCVKLSYSSDSSYFEILQSKNLHNLQEDKIISIGNNKAYVTSVKDENNIDIKISWISGGIQYSLCGNLPENSLVDIAKSIK